MNRLLKVLLCLALLPLMFIWEVARAVGLPMPSLALGVSIGGNTLNNLVPDIYVALDVVSRELTGFTVSAARNSTADKVVLGQNLRSIQTQKNTAGKDVTPGMLFPIIANQTIANTTLTITKSRAYPFSWSGEEQRGMMTGPGFLTIQQDQIAQCIRGLVNEVEADLANACSIGASRAVGTAGTTPFATNLANTANLRKVLDDNGAPTSDRHFVMNTTCGAAVRTLTQLTKANEAADTTMLRQGDLLDVHGFAFKESAQIVMTTQGTSVTANTNAAGYAKGATSITLNAAGTGTILAGDTVTFTGDTNQYVVTTNVAAVNAGTLIIAAPGLQVAIAAANTVVTIAANAAHNVGFSRNALVLATRVPYAPLEGDLALIREIIVDPRSGLAFELAVYPGYHMVQYELALAWGVLVTKPEHMALMLG